MIDLSITKKTGEKELTAWLEFIDGLDPIKGSMELAFRGELANLSDWFQNTRHVGLLYQPLLRWNGAEGLRVIRRWIDLSQEPYSRVEDELAALEPEPTMKFYYTVNLLSFYKGHLRSEIATISRRLLVRTGIFCELARLREGKYPDAIDVIDPLTGKSFDYSPTDGWIRTRHEELRAEGEHTWTLRQIE